MNLLFPLKLYENVVQQISVENETTSSSEQGMVRDIAHFRSYCRSFVAHSRSDFAHFRSHFRVRYENKTVVGTAAVFLFAYLSLDIPSLLPRFGVAVLCALGCATSLKFEGESLSLKVGRTWP